LLRMADEITWHVQGWQPCPLEIGKRLSRQRVEQVVTGKVKTAWIQQAMAEVLNERTSNLFEFIGDG